MEGGAARDAITIRSGFLRFLAMGGDAEAPVHAYGVRLVGAWIECRDSHGQPNLDFEGNLQCDLVIGDCLIDGWLSLWGASAMSLAFSGSLIAGTNDTGISLGGDALKTTGGLFLRDGFTAKGTVRLSGAQIGGNLDCSDGLFEGIDVALHCDGLKTAGDVALNDGFIAKGAIRLLGAQIGGNLDCSGGILGGDQISLFCDGLNTEGDVFLSDDCTAKGTVRLLGARIGGDLVCTGGNLEGSDAALICNIAIIEGSFFFYNVSNVNGRVSLYRAHIGAISDDPESWEKPDSIILNGCIYDTFAGDTTGRNAAYWTSWLGKQIPKHRTTDFKPFPYEHLAKVLRSMGHESEAREVLIAKRRQQRDVRLTYPEHYPRPKTLIGLVPWSLSIGWDCCLDIFIGYGYKPFRAMSFLILLTLLGWAIYLEAGRQGVMTPTDPLVYLSSDIPAECRNKWVMSTSPGGDPACMSAMPPEYAPFNPFHLFH